MGLWFSSPSGHTHLPPGAQGVESDRPVQPANSGATADHGVWHIPVTTASARLPPPAPHQPTPLGHARTMSHDPDNRDKRPDDEPLGQLGRPGGTQRQAQMLCLAIADTTSVTSVPHLRYLQPTRRIRPGQTRSHLWRPAEGSNLRRSIC